MIFIAFYSLEEIPLARSYAILINRHSFQQNCYKADGFFDDMFHKSMCVLGHCSFHMDGEVFEILTGVFVLRNRCPLLGV